MHRPAWIWMAWCLPLLVWAGVSCTGATNTCKTNSDCLSPHVCVQGICQNPISTDGGSGPNANTTCQVNNGGCDSNATWASFVELRDVQVVFTA